MNAIDSATKERRRKSPYSPGIDPAKLRYQRFVRNLWSQDDLATEADLSRAWIAKLEGGHGNPSVETLRKLCEALGCKPKDLLP
jgi:transcriptional regulator with XRE-family HTH domain